MTTYFESINARANSENTEVHGGERYISLTEEEQVTLKEAKQMEGFEFLLSGEEVKIKKVHSVSSMIHENSDGLYLAMTVQATLKFSNKMPGYEPTIENEFMVWIPENDGEPSQLGNFENMGDGTDINIDPEYLEDVCSRFEI